MLLANLNNKVLVSIALKYGFNINTLNQQIGLRQKCFSLVIMLKDRVTIRYINLDKTSYYNWMNLIQQLHYLQVDN